MAKAVATVLLLITASLAGWWELAANLGIGTEGFYKWLALPALGSAIPNDKADPGRWQLVF